MQTIVTIVSIIRDRSDSDNPATCITNKRECLDQTQLNSMGMPVAGREGSSCMKEQKMAYKDFVKEVHQ